MCTFFYSLLNFLEWIGKRKSLVWIHPRKLRLLVGDSNFCYKWCFHKKNQLWMFKRAEWKCKVSEPATNTVVAKLVRQFLHRLDILLSIIVKWWWLHFSCLCMYRYAKVLIFHTVVYIYLFF